MKVISLQSGSKGNCFYIESKGIALLIDAGISAKRLTERLEAFGHSTAPIQGVLVSHDHSDHCKSLGIFQRKFNVPIYITPQTLNAANRGGRLGTLHDVQYFNAGEIIEFGHVSVETFSTPHDGVDGVSFIIEAEGKRLGLFTDLGHVFDELRLATRSLDALILESNYDPEMLACCDRPEHVKERIASYRGHLSNREAANLVAAEAKRSLSWLCLAHLSEDNNTPELAMNVHREVLGDDIDIHVAYEHRPIMLPEL